MLLWRLSGVSFARVFDGGYGLAFDGRWNTVGRPVTYAATSPALCVLEKLVHVEDPALLPDLVMVRYQVPDDLVWARETTETMPSDWYTNESLTQQRGDFWLDGGTTPLLRVPSVIVPLRGSPDLNVLFNHRHPDVARITIETVEPFRLDVRLLSM